MEILLDNRFYVYIHRRLTDNKVFYVGKGNKNRAYSKCGRNKYWLRTYSKHGRSVEIVFDGLTSSEAFQAEIDTILEWRYFGHPLCNMTIGGDGSSELVLESRKKISEARKDKNLYTFTDENGKYLTGTRSDAMAFYNQPIHCIHTIIKRKVKNNGIGIVIDGESIPQAIKRLFKSIKGVNSKHSIKDKLRLVNLNGDVITGSRVEIAEKMNWNLTSFGGFIKNRRKTFFGYALVEEDQTDKIALDLAFNNKSFDPNIYDFLNIKTLEAFKCTRSELKSRTGVDVGDLFHLGRRVVFDYARVYQGESPQDVLKRLSIRAKKRTKQIKGNNG